MTCHINPLLRAGTPQATFSLRFLVVGDRFVVAIDGKLTDIGRISLFECPVVISDVCSSVVVTRKFDGECVVRGTGPTPVQNGISQ